MAIPVKTSPLVVILLCTYNGARFIRDQLDSIANQVHQNWVIFASDDGSTDGTVEILKQYQNNWLAGKLIIRMGPRNGFCQNFLSLANDQNIKGDYYAFCDQDDVWLPEKIALAIDKLISINNKNLSVAKPVVYCGVTTYVNEKLEFLSYSPLFKRPKSFRNALVQSVAGGNTMVFNRAAKSILENTSIVDVVSHDWWVYQIITGVGGEVYYDENSYILYRQHRDALVGGNGSLISQIKRIKKLLKGIYKNWNEKNIKALKEKELLLTKENKNTLNQFSELRKSTVTNRIKIYKNSKIYRQTIKGNISFYLALLFNKV